MSASVDGGIVSYYGTMVQRGTSEGVSGTADAVSVAIANKSIEAATEAMRQQYSGFMEFLA
ncbi:MAG: hypothetical protein HQL32_10100 [Planctomycetes bacterium]|nr:hypothetical protein [Planctomycetota bacterium]